GTDFIDTNYADIAKAAGLEAMRVTESSALPDAIDHFLALPGPALLDVVIDKRELAMPPKITLEQAKGFSLYMLRAVLSGKGNEVVEIAKTNLR
ncbi:MAG: ubiquinone-dependent pyruvate dehydrogenase, partial [Pusillimonas sp.]|nr:ubiquinone-dependent pyruvate dehydrogenase [Pusillimonas sp.]